MNKGVGFLSGTEYNVPSGAIPFNNIICIGNKISTAAKGMSHAFSEKSPTAITHSSTVVITADCVAWVSIQAVKGSQANQINRMAPTKVIKKGSSSANSMVG